MISVVCLEKDHNEIMISFVRFDETHNKITISLWSLFRYTMNYNSIVSFKSK